MTSGIGLGHPAFGQHRRYTRTGAVVLAMIVVIVGTEALLSRWIPTGGAPPRLVWSLDLLAALAIILVAASAVAGIVYGLVNGGPILAAMFPVGPLAVAGIVGGAVLPTLDTAVLLAGAAAGAGVGTVRALSAPTTGSRLVPIGIALTAALGTMAAWLGYTLLAAGGPRLLGGLLIAGLLLGIATVTGLWALVGAVIPVGISDLGHTLRRRFPK